MKEIKEIKAKEGMYLTQVSEMEDRIYVKALKGASINESDWREATQEEKIEYERKMMEKYEYKED